MSKFCIKKNAYSVMNPWLVEMRNAPSFRGSPFLYAGLDQILAPDSQFNLKTFSTVRDAEEFITSHPDSCDGKNIICQLNQGASGLDITPVTA